MYFYVDRSISVCVHIYNKYIMYVIFFMYLQIYVCIDVFLKVEGITDTTQKAFHVSVFYLFSIMIFLFCGKYQEILLDSLVLKTRTCIKIHPIQLICSSSSPPSFPLCFAELGNSPITTPRTRLGKGLCTRGSSIRLRVNITSCLKQSKLPFVQTCRKEMRWSNSREIAQPPWVLRVLFPSFISLHAALLLPAASGKAVSTLSVKYNFDTLLKCSERRHLLKFEGSD